MKAGHIQDLLEELMNEHHVPGAALALLDGDELIEVASGVANKGTGIEVTTETVFQVGSITKVWTAMLVMQLVDQGKIELDAPVRRYVTDFKVADPEASEIITIRELLSHSSGLDGDRFDDTGRGDDCVKEFVAACASLPQVAAPGEMFSYSNAGFVIAGRLVEAVTGQVWDAALKEGLLEPLGLRRTVTLPEDALLHRTAVGHIDPTGSGELTPAAVWGLPRSAGPAGNLCSTAADVIEFARVHLHRGVARDGMQVLSPESVSEMQKQQIELVDRWVGSGWGLGWNLYDWDGLDLCGHDGGTLGQKAFLRIVPEAGFALTLLTNGMTGPNLFKQLADEIFAQRFGVKVPDLSDMAARSIEFNPEPYVGVYQNEGGRTTIETDGAALLVSIELSGPSADIWPALEKVLLTPISETEFALRWPGYDQPFAVVFFNFDEMGCPGYVHWAGRANPRVGDSAAA